MRPTDFTWRLTARDATSMQAQQQRPLLAERFRAGALNFPSVLLLIAPHRMRRLQKTRIVAYFSA